MDSELCDQERWFLTKSMISRNRQFYDIQSINRRQAALEINRRRPVSKWDLPDDKFNMSFMNSTTAVEEKVERDIGRFKGRLSFDKESTEDGEALPQTYTFVSRTRSLPRRVKGIVPMDLCAPRKSLITQPKRKQLYDERLYNNFGFQKPDAMHTCDLSKKTGRERDITRYSYDLNYDLRNYEKLRYNSSEFRCLLDYKNQRPENERVYTQKIREEDLPSTDLNPERIDQGLRKTQPISIKGVNPFFNETGKEQPGQMHQRLNKANESYWKTGGRMSDDFSLQRMKQYAWEKRRSERRQSKHEVAREEVCMQYYFRRNTRDD